MPGGNVTQSGAAGRGLRVQLRSNRYDLSPVFPYPALMRPYPRLFRLISSYFSRPGPDLEPAAGGDKMIDPQEHIMYIAAEMSSGQASRRPTRRPLQP